MSRAVCVSGAFFSPEHDGILWAIARARGYTRDVWVPKRFVDVFSIPRVDSFPPVSLFAETGHFFFYHTAQLGAAPAALQSRFAEWSQKPFFPADLPPETNWRNTNGERLSAAFWREASQRVPVDARRHVYWATPDEASFIFDSPFDPVFVRASHAVRCGGDALCPPLAYYNVCGTRNPEVFHTHTCRPYRPHNFYGRPYPPCFAVFMKRLAIRYNCMDTRLWITVRRAQLMRVAVLPHVEPLSLLWGDEMLCFVNAAMTSEPRRVEASAWEHMESKRRRCARESAEDDTW